MTFLSTLSRLAAAGLALSIAGGMVPTSASAQGQQDAVAVLRVDMNAPEIQRFKSDKALRSARVSSFDAKANAAIATLKLPVLGFAETPSLVLKALGPAAKTVKPRLVISDPANPIWYHIVDNYGDISITVDADLRINQVADDNFRIHKAPLSLEGITKNGKTAIAIFDGAREEGMEGVIAEYTVHKFDDIPYKVTIECRGNAKSACRDRAAIAADQGRLELIAVP